MKRNVVYVVTIIFFLLAASFNLINASEGDDKISFQNNLEKAFKIAKTEDKHVLVYFSGSDWCRPCMQLHQEVFESNEFIEFAN